MSLGLDKKGHLCQLTDRAVLAAVFHDFWCQVAIAALLKAFRFAIDCEDDGFVDIVEQTRL